MIKLSHIINPVSEKEHAELFETQKISFASLIKAKEYAEKICSVELCTIQRSSDNNFIPTSFISLPALTRDVRDLVKETNKPYPFLGDIISAHAKFSEADYLIYTNLDIAVMPFFYEAIIGYIQQGHDAVVINRRRLNNRYEKEKNLALLYAEAGRDHTGYDCFVIKKSLIQKFIFKDICLAVPGAGNDLFYNVFTFAENPILFTEKHLTFHVGFELYKAWGDEATNLHNQKEFLKLLQELKPLMKADKFPGADLSLFSRHFKWLMNPTFHYPTMFALDAQRGFKKSLPKFEQSFNYTPKQRYLEWLIRIVNFKE